MPANRFGPALLLRLKIVKKKKKKKGRHKTFPSGASPGRAVDSLHLLTKTNETQRVPRNASISHSFGKRRKKKTLRLMQSNKKAVASFFLFLALPPPDNELIRFSTRLLLRGRMDESDSTSRDCCATSARYAIITTRPCRPFSFSLSFFLLAGRFTLHNKWLAGNGVNLCVLSPIHFFQKNSAQSESIAISGRHWAVEKKMQSHTNRALEWSKRFDKVPNGWKAEANRANILSIYSVVGRRREPQLGRI